MDSEQRKYLLRRLQDAAIAQRPFRLTIKHRPREILRAQQAIDRWEKNIERQNDKERAILTAKQNKVIAEIYKGDYIKSLRSVEQFERKK